MSGSSPVCNDETDTNKSAPSYDSTSWGFGIINVDTLGNPENSRVTSQRDMASDQQRIVMKNGVGSGLGFAWALAPHYHQDRLGDSLPCFRYESSFPRSFGMGTGPSSQLWPPTP